MHERYSIETNYINEEPFSYTVGYMHHYGGADYQVAWRSVETFYNKDVAQRVCDELNAKRILEQTGENT